jgi:hypothetical protein
MFSYLDRADADKARALVELAISGAVVVKALPLDPSVVEPIELTAATQLDDLHKARKHAIHRAPHSRLRPARRRRSHRPAKPVIKVFELLGGDYDNRYLAPLGAVAMTAKHSSAPLSEAQTVSPVSLSVSVGSHTGRASSEPWNWIVPITDPSS